MINLKNRTLFSSKCAFTKNCSLVSKKVGDRNFILILSTRLGKNKQTGRSEFESIKYYNENKDAVNRVSDICSEIYVDRTCRR